MDGCTCPGGRPCPLCGRNRQRGADRLDAVMVVAAVALAIVIVLLVYAAVTYQP
jgi:hypothetical protein